MKKIILFTFYFLVCISFQAKSNQTKIIDLNNKSIDQLANDILTDITIEEEISVDTDQTLVISIDEDNNKSMTADLLEVNNIWKKTNKEDIIYLTENINDIYSNILTKQIISILDINTILPNDFEKEDFDYLIIKNLINFGDRRKAFESIQGLELVLNPEYNFFYKQFELNFLLSNYNNLRQACDFNEEVKNETLLDVNNFFLKVDIFCLLLNEKFNEANLLNTLLIDSETDEDEYFQYLFNSLQKSSSTMQKNDTAIDEDNVFLYIAMHQIGKIPLSDNFFSRDPINLSMAITLNSSTNINLRIKAAHLAYANGLLSIDSLAALYQLVDFSLEELNNPSNIELDLNKDIEIGMAYFYELINIQLLPISRLEALVNFWEFSEKNDLEIIAYDLSRKFLNSIDPSNELANYSPKIAKAYIFNKDFDMAKKWLLFGENSIANETMSRQLNSSRLLLNLYNNDNSNDFINILFSDLQKMNKGLLDKSGFDYKIKNQILFLIFNVLNQEIENPFYVERVIEEMRVMPSIYITNKIRESIASQNDVELLFSIIVSLGNKKWSEIHPEHLRLILNGFKNYKQGLILNSILLEILDEIKII